MPDMTLSIPEELYKKMKEHKGIRWPDVVRKAIGDYVYRLEKGKLEVTTEELLEELGSEFEKDLSEISFEEAVRFSHAIQLSSPLRIQYRL